MEVEEHLLSDPHALAVIKRAFELEADAHGYALDGEWETTEGVNNPNALLIAQPLKNRA